MLPTLPRSTGLRPVLAPFNARMWEPSTAAPEKSRALALRSLVRRTSCSRGHIPAPVHCEVRAAGDAPLEILVRDGVVVLRGRVRSGADTGAAIWAAWRVEGVIGVVNQLTVPAERRTQEELRD